MTRREILRGLKALPIILPVSACSLLRHWTYRYRLTVLLSVAGREYVGLSVIQITRWSGVGGIGADVKGEAATIDTGKSGLVFAALVGADGSQGWPESIVHQAFSSKLGIADGASENAIGKISGLVGHKAELKPENYPMMVRFKDTDNPKTVEAIGTEDISAGGGSPFEIRRVTIEITDDPVTHGIDRRLGWVGLLSGSLAQDNKINVHQPERDLTRSAFLRRF